jgi:lysine-specific demethylase 3
MSARYKDVPFSKCLACTRRWAGDTCRFQHLRYFLHDQESGEIPGFAFIEYHRTPYTTPTFTFPSKFNVPLTAEHIKELKVGCNA